jgi:hypothetical protein
VAEDPATGRETRLFDPRRNQWGRHFRILKNLRIEGLTVVARATAAKPDLNGKARLTARALWRRIGIYPAV